MNAAFVSLLASSGLHKIEPLGCGSKSNSSHLDRVRALAHAISLQRGRRGRRHGRRSRWERRGRRWPSVVFRKRVGERPNLRRPRSCGAGAKRSGGRPCVPHRARPEHQARHPVHITLRSRAGLPSFRGDVAYEALLTAFSRASNGAFRIIQFCVQIEHMHLLVEADDRTVRVETGAAPAGHAVARAGGNDLAGARGVAARRGTSLPDGSAAVGRATRQGRKHATCDRSDHVTDDGFVRVVADIRSRAGVTGTERLEARVTHPRENGRRTTRPGTGTNDESRGRREEELCHGGNCRRDGCQALDEGRRRRPPLSARWLSRPPGNEPLCTFAASEPPEVPAAGKSEWG